MEEIAENYEQDSKREIEHPGGITAEVVYKKHSFRIVEEPFPVKQ
jgi:hypothetical protein